jgi:hypothetical protein
MIDVPPCEFCGKSHDQVKRLIVSIRRFEEYPTGQQHVICNECIIQNMQVLAYESAAQRDELIAILQAIEPKNTK